MKGLAGDFATMPLLDLTLHLGNRRASGMLRIESESVRKTAALREGSVVSASSDEPREFLGQFLIHLGHLTEEQFEWALQEQHARQGSLGRLLVREGLVPESMVRMALDLKFRETLLEALRWREGSFHFEPGAPPLPSEDAIEVAVDLLDIHREAEFRETAWQAIRAAFPSGRVRLTVDASRLPAPLPPGSVDARILQMAHEGLTLDDMLVALHSTDFHLYQRLYALYRQEVVRPRAETEAAVRRGTPPPAALGTVPPAPDIRAHARALLAGGNPHDAVVLAQRAHDLEPTEASQALLREAEEALLEALRAELVATPQVPTLTVPYTHLKTLGLGAAERYLLSRVDGTRDIGTIARVSPLRELDALRHFRSFERRGLILLRPGRPPAPVDTPLL